MITIDHDSFTVSTRLRQVQYHRAKGTRRMHTRYFDKSMNRLVYVGEQATEKFWDAQWSLLMEATFKSPPNNRFITSVTRRYLLPGAKVLEGGCGMGDKVNSLDKAGFDAYGVDFAPEVVKKIKEGWPHLKVECSDVRNLPFDNDFFDGYWSFGVIEHFFDGYDDILSEIKRVIRKNGHLFLTFPMLNMLRERKANRNRYPLFDEDSIGTSHFYQFALDPDSVIDRLERRGFVLKHRGGMSSLKCLGDEYKGFRRIGGFLNRLPYGLGTKINIIVDLAIGKYIGHVCLLIFENAGD